MKSNLANALDELERRKERVLEIVGTIVVNNVKLKIRSNGLIDTGRLVSSITYAVQGDGVVIGTNVKYAVYLELGTVHIRAYHFLVDGLLDSRGQIVATLEAA